MSNFNSAVVIDSLESRRLFSLMFGQIKSFAAGNTDQPLATADFNGDHKPDLVVGSYNSGTASIFLNQGGGVYKLASTVTVGGGTSSIVVGDFNHDGKPDLAMIGNDLVVALNLGNGKFAAPVHYTAGEVPQNVIAADFNHDGKLDLAVTDIFGDAVLVFKGNGNGTFAKPVTYGGIPGAADLVAGDFQGNGKIDLAVTSFGHITITSAGAVTNGPSDGVRLLIDNGDGTFKLGADFKVYGSHPTDIAAGDLNGDGKLDLVTTDGGLGGDVGTNTASVLMNYGGGHFAYPKVEQTGGSPQYVTLADVNGDGKLDIITADYAGNDVSVFIYRSGPDYYDPGIQITGLNTPSVALVLDVNGDKKLDLVTDSNDLGVIDVLLGL